MITTQDILIRHCNPQDACLLFTRLPAELRTCIYEYVLTVRPEDEHGSIRLIHHLPGQHAPPSVLTLLETCRLIHNEALGIFFLQNRFRLSFKTALATGCGHKDPFPYVSPSRLVYIQELVVDVGSPASVTQVCRLLSRDLPQLRYLRIVVPDLWNHFYGDDAISRDQDMLEELSEAREEFKLALAELEGSLKEFHLIWEDYMELEHQGPRSWQDFGEGLSREMGMDIFFSRRGPVKPALT